MGKTLEERFWPKVDKSGDCWVWTASKHPGGYGQIAMKPRGMRGAHRVAWEMLRGPVPEGMQLDHLCRNRACVNPAHMEVVDQRTNVLRGSGHTAVNARKTVCKRGHSLADAYVHRGMRECRTCKLMKQKRYRKTGSAVLT